MKSNKLALAARFVLGLIFFVFGLNGFLQFIPQPPPPEDVKAFMTGMMSAPYFFPVLKGTEVICGLLLLSGRFQSLALVILAPIALQITLFHSTFAREGLPMAIFIDIAGIYLAKTRWSTFKSLFE
jgi:putative oxidoreductase